MTSTTADKVNPTLTISSAVLFAMAGGISVANLYYAQPIISIIAHSLNISQASLAIPLGATQISYALGILCIVPLGDYLDRKKIIPIILALAGISLFMYTCSTSFIFLTISSVLLGCTAVSGQLLIPLTGDLAPQDKRGKFVGIVASGLVIGLLSARVLSGFLTSLWGWRSIFCCGAILSLSFAFILWQKIPVYVDNPPTHSYFTAVLSVFHLVRRNRTLYVTMCLGAINFGSFVTFWTVLALLLTKAPYYFSAWQIGLFALVGMLSAIAVQGVGRLYDRGYINQAIGIFGAVMLIGWILSYLGGTHLAILIIAIICLDIGSQSQNILNQTRILSLAGHARSRVNTAYVTGNFIAAALGSMLALKLWFAWGWHGICYVGILAAVICLLLLVIAVRHGVLEDTILFRSE